MDISLRSEKRRLEKRRLDCYTFKELYEFFSQFYGISTTKHISIGDSRKWCLHNSDIEFSLKSFNKEGLVTEFHVMTWSGGWSHKQKFLHLSVGFISIGSNNFLDCIVNFIIENESDCYALPFVLKRQLVINSLIDEV